MNNQYPAKPMMDQMAQYGRYGDSMLVHMNPVEVAGIASLSPTGNLTINPVTGQPEAFLPFLAPALGMLGTKLGLGALGSAALTGIGTAAVTGDLKRGLLSGLTAGLGSGLAEGIGGLVEGAQEGINVATTSAESLGTGAELAAGATDAATSGLNLSTATLAEGFVPPGGTDFLAQAQTAGQQAAQAAGTLPPVDYVAQSQQIAQDASAALSAPPAPYVSEAPGMVGQFDTAVSGSRIGEGFQNVVDKFGTTGQIMGIGVLEGAQAGEAAQEDFKKQQRRLMEEEEASMGESRADLQRAYAAAQPGVARGDSPYRSQMSQRTRDYAAPSTYAAEGGIVRMNRGGPAPGLSVKQIYDALVGAGIIDPNVTSFDDYATAYYTNNPSQGGTGEGEESADPTPKVTDKFEVLDEDGVDMLAPGYYGIKEGVNPEDTQEYKALQKAEAGEILTPKEQSFLERYYNRRERFRTQRERSIKAAQPEGANPYADLLANTNIFGYTAPAGALQGIDPVEIQRSLRPNYKIASPLDYMAGFEPEFQYFQDDPNAPFIPNRAFRPTLEGVESGGQYFDPILQRGEYLSQLQDYYRTLASYGMGGANAPAEPVDEEPPASGNGSTGGSSGGSSGSSGGSSGSSDGSSGSSGGSSGGSSAGASGSGSPGGSSYPSGGGYSGTIGSTSGGASQSSSGGSYYRIVDGKIIAYDMASVEGVDPSVYAGRTALDGTDAPNGYYVANERVLGSVGDDPFIIPGSKGIYGEGIYYKDGGLHNYISQEKLNRKRSDEADHALKSAKFIDPALMTEEEKFGMARLTGSMPSSDNAAVGMSDWNAGSGDNPDTYITQDDFGSMYGSGDGLDSTASSSPDTSTAQSSQSNAPALPTVDATAPSTAPDTGTGSTITPWNIYGPPGSGTPIDTPYEGSFQFYRDRANEGVGSVSPVPNTEAITVAAPSRRQTKPADGIAGIPGINIDPATIQAAMAASNTPATPPAGAPELTPEQEEAMNQALGAIQSGGGFLNSMGRFPFQEGGRTLVGSLGSRETPAGGIAEVDSEFAASPSEQDVTMLASALLGGAPEADQIIQMFLGKYGPEVFGQVREMILSMVTPNAQNEGMIRGQGGGMDDMIPGMIGASQPVAVSPGEYIVPADVVSDLGDGSSDAGADELDSMLERVRMARGGTADQPPAIEAQRVMPR